MSENSNYKVYYPEIFEYPIKEFKEHLLKPNNSRIIFSGKFGAGKTSFLNEFFEKESQQKILDSEKFIAYRLSPVNYSVSSNEDIMQYIKYDIIWELLRNNAVVDESKKELPESLKIFLGKNLHKVLAAFISIIPKIGKDVYDAFEKLDKIKDEFLKFHYEENNSSADKMIDFIKEVEQTKGTIYETDIITNIIIDTIVLHKTEAQESVLIIDDLDRLDPEHIFRILNVFAAHFDYEKHGRLNKFGFDKIILVCDLNNIRNIFYHKYGADVDFMGYINKFYSTDVYYFDNKEAVTKVLEQLLRSIKPTTTSPDESEKSIHGTYLKHGFLSAFLFFLMSQFYISLRNCINVYEKEINYHWSEVKIGYIYAFEGWRIPLILQLKFVNQLLGGYSQFIKILNDCQLRRHDFKNYDIYFPFFIYVISSEYHSFRENCKFYYSYMGIELSGKTEYDIYTLRNVFLKRVVHDNTNNEIEEVFHPTIEMFWQAFIDTVNILHSNDYLQ